LVLWIAYFNGAILPNNKFRDRTLMSAFRQAKPWHYGAFFLLRSPALMAAIVVYTAALNLFGVEASLITLMPFLPVIFFAAAVPTPMRAAAMRFLGQPRPRERGSDGRHSELDNTTASYSSIQLSDSSSGARRNETCSASNG